MQRETRLTEPFGVGPWGQWEKHVSRASITRIQRARGDISGPLEGARQHVRDVPGTTLFALEPPNSPRNMHYLTLPVEHAHHFLHLAVGHVDSITGVPTGGVAAHVYEV